jgi:serine-type D-Ala-D-Ala carboxypeptidase/endopeptidase
VRVTHGRIGRRAPEFGWQAHLGSDNRTSRVRENAPLRERVAEIVERYGRKHVGIAVGLLSRNGIETFAHGQVAPDSIFEIGSITKVFTATVLADMALEGLVALDDPVARYLPEGVAPPVRGRPITLADLASHSSGLPRVPKGFLRRVRKEMQDPYARYGADDLYADVPRTRPRRPPGKRPRYSNYGAGLLGHALARRAGTSYEELVRERICEPLGLADTFVHVPEDKRDRFVQGHDRRGRPVPGWEFDALAGAGALRSTVADLLRFLALQLDDSDSRLGAAARLTHEPRARGLRRPIGLGWLTLPLRGQHALYHDGGTGGYRSFAGFVREQGTGVVALTNSARWVNKLGAKSLEAISRT